MLNFQIYNEDCLLGLKKLENNSIDLCLTDPPYFLKYLDSDWNADQIEEKLPKDKKPNGINHLPQYMKFKSSDGLKFQTFYNIVSREIYRVLKPGGFFLSFSSPRLYHRMVLGIEDAGFEIRDMLGWIYGQSQGKAFGLHHIIDKNTKLNLTLEEKHKIKLELRNYKTPQLRPAIDPICLAQKPVDGTYLENWINWGVGLMDTQHKIGEFKNKIPANILVDEYINDYLKIFTIPKANVMEKAGYNNHPSVKPLAVCEQLIKLFSKENAMVLDPFNGSGTTGIAAYKLSRNYIGYEISQSYIDISYRRLADIKNLQK